MGKNKHIVVLNEFIRELVIAGKVKKVRDRSYGLKQTAETYRYVDQGHKEGKAVIPRQHSTYDSRT